MSTIYKRFDNESDLRSSIKTVMDDLVDNHPEKVKKMFHQMIDMCELTDKREDSMKTIEKMKDNNKGNPTPDVSGG